MSIRYSVYPYDFKDIGEGNIVIGQWFEGAQHVIVLTRSQINNFRKDLDWFVERMDENNRREQINKVIKDNKKTNGN